MIHRIQVTFGNLVGPTKRSRVSLVCILSKIGGIVGEKEGHFTRNAFMPKTGR